MTSQTPSSTKIQLTLYASKLKNVAGAFKGTSDPYAVVTLLAGDQKDKPVVLGKTEVIKNSLNPRWTTSFLIDYELGKPARINVGVYDEIRKAKTNKPMGSALFEIGEVLGTRGNVKAKKLRDGGVVYARVERAKQMDSGTFYLALHGIKLKNVDGFLGKSDPFFEISRQIKEGEGTNATSYNWVPMYRSKPIMNNLNPKWEAISLDMNQLCDGDRDKPILITVYDWEKKGKHTNMGQFETTVNGLARAITQGNLGNVKKIDTKKGFELKRKGKPFGTIIVTAASVTAGQSSPAAAKIATAATANGFTVPAAAVAAPPTAQMSNMALGYNLPTPVAPPGVIPVPAAAPAAKFTNQKPNFIDYVSGGCELQMSIAVDFTGSNGDPRRPGTLHYIHKDGQLNDYEKALTAVGQIVAKYDSDQKFPVWGFGAKFGGVIQHCFQVGRKAEAEGLGEVLEAYRGTFKLPLTMSGPTVFTEVIQIAAAQARSKQEAAKRVGQQAYSILLILTDGAVSDVHATRAAIQAASDAPLSIVIIGIGSADFSAMQFLDDFQSASGGGLGRDICQFVEFNKHQYNKISLTQATLDEIPDQVVDYFHSKGIRPLAEVRGSQMSLVPDAYNVDEDVDLTMDISPDGEISLANNEGYYDDTSYGNVSNYLGGVAVLPPPTAAHSGAPPAPFNPAASAPSAYNNYPPQQSHAPQHQQHRYSSSPNNNVVTASVVSQPVFHVQLPPGVSAGMQLQVQNPQTRQNMIITVPPGVAPGGTFSVPY